MSTNKVRLVIRHDYKEHCGLEGSDFETIDIDCPALAEKLATGGLDVDTYSVRSVIGAELVANDDRETGSVAERTLEDVL